MRKFNRILAAVLVVLALTVVIAPAVVRAASVPGDVYYVPGSGITLVVMTIGSDHITINGVQTAIDAGPQVRLGRTFMPIRFIVAALGGTIAWNATTHTVTIHVGTTTIVLVIGQNYALVNGVRVAIDSNPAVVPYIQEPGRTMLPIDFIAEQLGAFVVWNATLQQMTLVFANP